MLLRAKNAFLSNSFWDCENDSKIFGFELVIAERMSNMLPKYSLKEVSAHTSPDDLWMVIHNKGTISLPYPRSLMSAGCYLAYRMASQHANH